MGLPSRTSTIVHAGHTDINLRVRVLAFTKLTPRGETDNKQVNRQDKCYEDKYGDVIK